MSGITFRFKKRKISSLYSWLDELIPRRSKICNDLSQLIFHDACLPYFIDGVYVSNTSEIMYYVARSRDRYKSNLYFMPRKRSDGPLLLREPSYSLLFCSISFVRIKSRCITVWRGTRNVKHPLVKSNANNTRPRQISDRT